MRRRDFTIGLGLAVAVPTAQAQEQVKQHRIAIVIPAGSVAQIDDAGNRFYRAFWEELRRSGDVEGQNLVVERYSAEGRHEGYGDLARQVVSRNPDVIVAVTDAIAQAVRAVTGTTPIVWIGGDPTQVGFAKSLAHPGGNITGVTVNAGAEIFGKRLQILKETVPSTSRVAWLTTRTSGSLDKQLHEAGWRLGISVIDLALHESTPPEIERLFADAAQERVDAIILNSHGDFLPHRQLIVKLAENNRLPAIYPWREYMEVGGLMAYATDLVELSSRMADDVHQILDGAKPGDIPIYQPTKYEFLINLKTAKTLGLTFPPAVLATAAEVIE